jgi:hypothetical protein
MLNPYTNDLIFPVVLLSFYFVIVESFQHDFKFFINFFFKKNKYKPVEPIDYDEYIEKNGNNLKKDNLKNLIFLPDDDIYVSNLNRIF